MRRALSESLLGVIAQGLIRTTDSKRAAFHDILINTDACRDYIQRGALDEVEEIMERSGFDGMVTINQSLLALVEAGKVDGEKAVAVSLKPNELAQALTRTWLTVRTGRRSPSEQSAAQPNRRTDPTWRGDHSRSQLEA